MSAATAGVLSGRGEKASRSCSMEDLAIARLMIVA
jgi:hypothetical protein